MCLQLKGRVLVKLRSPPPHSPLQQAGRLFFSEI